MADIVDTILLKITAEVQGAAGVQQLSQALGGLTGGVQQAEQALDQMAGQAGQHGQEIGRNLERGIERGLSQGAPGVERQAREQGQRIGQGATDGVERGTAGVGGVLGRLQGTVGGVMGKVAGFVEAFAGPIAAVAAGVGVVLPFLADAVSTAADLEQALNSLKAVSGATDEQLGQLKAQALDLGARFIFTAQEIVGAQEELSKAGVGIGDILDGAAEGAALLAQATGIELADAVDIGTKAMNVFGLAGKDFGRIADVISNGANTSALDVKTFGTALQQVGPVAGMAGLSLEQTTAILSVFADNALEGSDAGTSLKTMLLALMAPSKDAARELKGLGIDVYTAEKELKSLGVQAHDSGGNLRPFGDILADLSKRLDGMTEKQRNAALATIAGSDAIRALGILYKTGADKLQDLTDAMGQQGTAQQNAETRTAGLRSAQERLNGAIEAFKTKVGDFFLPAITAIVDAAGQGVDALTKLFDTLDKAINGTDTEQIGTKLNFARTQLKGLKDELAAGERQLKEQGANISKSDRERMNGVLADIRAEIEKQIIVVGTLQRAYDKAVGATNKAIANQPDHQGPQQGQAGQLPGAGVLNAVGVGSAPITQEFGMNPGKHGYGAAGHQGLDIGVTSGTQLLAPFAGKAQIGFDPKGYGNFIKIFDKAGQALIFGHLSAIDQAIKDQVQKYGYADVTKGMKIGLSGSTGNSTGPHLHLEGRTVDRTPVDPRTLLYNGTPLTVPGARPKTSTGSPGQDGPDMAALTKQAEKLYLALEKAKPSTDAWYAASKALKSFSTSSDDAALALQGVREKYADAKRLAKEAGVSLAEVNKQREGAAKVAEQIVNAEGADQIRAAQQAEAQFKARGKAAEVALTGELEIARKGKQSREQLARDRERDARAAEADRKREEAEAKRAREEAQRNAEQAGQQLAGLTKKELGQEVGRRETALKEVQGQRDRELEAAGQDSIKRLAIEQRYRDQSRKLAEDVAAARLIEAKRTAEMTKAQAIQNIPEGIPDDQRKALKKKIDATFGGDMSAAYRAFYKDMGDAAHAAGNRVTKAQQDTAAAVRKTLKDVVDNPGLYQDGGRRTVPQMLGLDDLKAALPTSEKQVAGFTKAMQELAGEGRITGDVLERILLLIPDFSQVGQMDPLATEREGVIEGRLKALDDAKQAYDDGDASGEQYARTLTDLYHGFEQYAKAAERAGNTELASLYHIAAVSAKQYAAEVGGLTDALDDQIRVGREALRLAQERNESGGVPAPDDGARSNDQGGYDFGGGFDVAGTLADAFTGTDSAQLTQALRLALGNTFSDLGEEGRDEFFSRFADLTKSESLIAGLGEDATRQLINLIGDSPDWADLKAKLQGHLAEAVQASAASLPETNAGLAEVVKQGAEIQDAFESGKTSGDEFSRSMANLSKTAARYAEAARLAGNTDLADTFDKIAAAAHEAGKATLDEEERAAKRSVATLENSVKQRLAVRQNDLKGQAEVIKAEADLAREAARDQLTQDLRAAQAGQGTSADAYRKYQATLTDITATEEEKRTALMVGGINMFSQYAQQAIPMITAAMQAIGGASEDGAAAWGESLGSMVSDLTNFATSLAKGDYLGAVIGFFTSIFTGFARQAAAARAEIKRTQEYNNQFRFDKEGGYGSRTVETRTSGFLWWQKTEYIEKIDEAKKSTALAIEGGIVNGVQTGFQKALESGNFEDFGKTLRESVSNAVKQGFVDDFLNDPEVGKAYKDAVSGYLNAKTPEEKAAARKNLIAVTESNDAKAKATFDQMDEIDRVTGQGRYSPEAIAARERQAKESVLSVEEKRLNTERTRAKFSKENIALEAAHRAGTIDDAAYETAKLAELQQYESRALALTLRRLKLQMEAELATTGLTEEQKQLIRDQYAANVEGAQADFDSTIADQQARIDQARESSAAQARQAAEAARQAQEQYRDGLRGALGSGVQALLSGQGSPLQAMYDAVRGRIQDAVLSGFRVKQSLKALDPLFDQLGGALSAGLDPSAIVSKIAAALPALSAKLSVELGPLATLLNQVLPNAINANTNAVNGNTAALNEANFSQTTVVDYRAPVASGRLRSLLSGY